MDKLHRKKQWSIKLDNGEIWVAQEDTTIELVLSREEIMAEIKKLKLKEDIDKVPIEDEIKEPEEYVDHTLGSDICEVHNVKMKERNGKNGKFYSHGRQLKDESWDWCSGKGYNSER